MENALREHAAQINEAIATLVEMEGMKAANRERETNGCAPAYGEDAFSNLLEKNSLGYNGRIIKARNFY